MKHTVKHAINHGVTVTDDNFPTPMIVIDGKVYGDADIIDSGWEGDDSEQLYWQYTGYDIKRTISQTECRGNRELYDFVTRSTDLPTYDEMMDAQQSFEGLF